MRWLGPSSSPEIRASSDEDTGTGWRTRRTRARIHSARVTLRPPSPRSSGAARAPWRRRMSTWSRVTVSCRGSSNSRPSAATARTSYGECLPLRCYFYLSPWQLLAHYLAHVPDELTIFGLILGKNGRNTFCSGLIELQTRADKLNNIYQ